MYNEELKTHKNNALKKKKKLNLKTFYQCQNHAELYL